MPQYRGTAIYNKYCGAVAPPAIGGKTTLQQQIIMNGAQQIIQQGIQQLLNGNSEQEAAARAQAAALAAAEQQRQAVEQARRAAALKGQLMGVSNATDTTASTSLMGPKTTTDLQIMTVNQTPFFNTKVPKCPGSQDTPADSPCSRGAPADPNAINIDPNATSRGGAGLTTGDADTPGKANVREAMRAPASNMPPHDVNAVKPVPDDTTAALAKLAPLLREPDSAKGGPIATADRPAICESLSRQLAETYQLARRAVLAADVYERYEPKKATLGVIASFDRISDNSSEMRALFPPTLFPAGMSSQSIKSLLEPDDSDYRAAIYRDRNDPKKIILAFRGTKTLADWANSNAAQATGLGSIYYAKAIALANILKKSAAAKGYELEIVGHSMGGGMGDAAGAASQVTTTSFNPSGVHVNSLPKGTDMSAVSQYVSDYVVNDEPLNLRQDHPLVARADAVAISAAVGPLMPAALAAGTATAFAGGGSENLQDITALNAALMPVVNGALPAAIGQRIALTPDPGDVYPGNLLRLHSMSGVIDAIVAHSRELHEQYVFNECGS